MRMEVLQQLRGGGFPFYIRLETQFLVLREWRNSDRKLLLGGKSLDNSTIYNYI